MFNITINQPDLIEVLNILDNTVGKNANNLSDNCISMETTGLGTMKCYTTNTIETTECEVTIGGTGSTTVDKAPYVDFNRFKAIISSIPATEVVSLTETASGLDVSYGLKRKPISLASYQQTMLGVPTITSTDTITVETVYLGHALNNACAIIVDNQSAPIYNCVRIATNGMEIEVTALDTTHKRTFMRIFTGTQNNPTTSVLLEASKLKKMIKDFKNIPDLEITIDNNAVKITGTNNSNTNSAILSISYYARKLTGAFPATIRQNFAQLPNEFCDVNTADIMNSLARVKAIDDSNGGNVQFKADDDTCMFLLKSTLGNVEDDILMNSKIASHIDTIFKYAMFAEVIKEVGDVCEIAPLPLHPTNFIVRPKGNSNFMFTVPTVAVQTNNP